MEEDKQNNNNNNNIIRKCFIIKMGSNVGNTKIEITDGIPSFLGRNQEYGILDICCSRKQISLLANVKNYIVNVELMGINSSYLNGMTLVKSKKYVATHNDVLSLDGGEGLLYYKIQFDPAPSPSSTSLKPSTKHRRKSSTSIEKTGGNNGRDADNVCKELPIKKIKLENLTQNDQLKANNNGDGDHDDKVPIIIKPSIVNQWETYDNGKLLIYTTKDVYSRGKIGAYDLDGTIITTQSNNVFAKDIHDWKFAFNSTIGTTLKSKYNDGYKIVIFTNQMGLSRGKTSVTDFKKKIENIVRKLEVPVQIFIATDSGIYRKPLIGMWTHLCKMKNDQITVNLKQSYFVGDAAGRCENKVLKKKKDFSSADILFAINIGVKFETPEQHFQRAPIDKFQLPEFNPYKIVERDLLNPINTLLKLNKLDVILMVGLPGSGKSTFCRQYLEKIGYSIINLDILRTKPRCLDMLKKYLSEKKSCVIDNTNPDQNARRPYIDMAKQFNANCRCFKMGTSFEQALHNNRFRELINTKHVQVQPVVFHTFRKTYRPPTISEGFSEIVEVNLKLKFENAEEEKLYRMYLLDK